MSARTTWFLAVALVMLSLPQVSMGNGGLTGIIDLDSNLVDPDNVSPSTSITIDVSGTQSGAATGLNQIHLNWIGSSSQLNLDSAGTWVWDSDTDAFDDGGGFVTNDDDLSDFIVDRLGAGYLTTASFDIGTLTFNGPSTPGTYNLDLTGYTTDLVDNTWFWDGTTFIIYGSGLSFSAGSGLNFDGSSVYSFTVIPEPTSMVLLSAAGLVALLKRRKKT